MKAKVYIILLNFNNWKDTLECLESIISSKHSSYQTVIVDNCSADDSIKRLQTGIRKMGLKHLYYEKAESEDRAYVIKNEGPRRVTGRKAPVIIIKSDSNNGFSAGNNIGMKYALLKNDGDYCWILNNDTIIFPDTLSEMVKTGEEEANCGMVGSKLIFYYDRETVQTLGNDNVGWKGIGNGSHDGVRDSADLDGILEMKSIIGASLLVKNEVIDKIGFMDEKYFMYHEESDWCARAARAGYRLLTNCRSRILHKEGGSMGRKRTVKSFMGRTASRTTITDFLIWGYYSLRNEIYFVRRNYPSKYPLFLLLVLPKKFIVKSLSIFLFNDDHKTARLYLVLRGLFDGILGRMGKTIDTAAWKKKYSV